MSIYQYAEALLPNFERASLREDLDQLQEKLDTVAIPSYQTGSEIFTKKAGFKNKQVKNYDATILNYGKRATVSRAGTSVDYIYEVLKKMSNNHDGMNKMMDKYLGRDVAREGITFPKLNFVRYVEVFGFIQRYANSYLLWVLSLEVPEMLDGRPTVSEPFTKAELKWLEDNLIAFAKMLPAYDVGEHELAKTFGEIPDLVVDSRLEEVNSAITSKAKLDPFGFNSSAVPLIINPIYHFRMAVANYNISQWNKAQEEKAALELRLIQAEHARNGDRDPALEEKIRKMDVRLKEVNYKIQTIEAKYD